MYTLEGLSSVANFITAYIHLPQVIVSAVRFMAIPYCNLLDLYKQYAVLYCHFRILIYSPFGGIGRFGYHYLS